MPSILCTIRNSDADDCICYVYDRFGKGNREVSGSPFALAGRGEASPEFSVNTNVDGFGLVKYDIEGGEADEVEVTEEKNEIVI